MIKFLDLKKINSSYKKDFLRIAKNELDSGQYIGGESVQKFENSYAKFCSAKYCISVGNGFDALKIALLAFGIKENDEVIVPSNTFIATWLAVSDIGAVPIAVDVSPVTFNIDIDKIRSNISSKTKAVIGVDLYGRPCESNKISKICKAHGLFFLQDSAQSHGASYLGQKIGSDSHAVAWSFYPGKNLGALGDSGAVTTNNKK